MFEAEAGFGRSVLSNRYQLPPVFAQSTALSPSRARRIVFGVSSLGPGNAFSLSSSPPALLKKPSLVIPPKKEAPPFGSAEVIIIPAWAEGSEKRWMRMVPMSCPDDPAEMRRE